MNRVILIGRLTKDPTGDNAARYTLAVDGYEEHTDFISCVTFGSTADFARKYLRKGMKIAVEGRLNTGSYEKDGKKVYTTDVIVDRHEFCEKKGDASNEASLPDIPEGLGDFLPFE